MLLNSPRSCLQIKKIHQTQNNNIFNKIQLLLQNLSTFPHMLSSPSNKLFIWYISRVYLFPSFSVYAMSECVCMCTQMWHTECGYIFHLDSSCPFGSEAGKYYITQKILLLIKVTPSVTAFCAHFGPRCVLMNFHFFL